MTVQRKPVLAAIHIGGATAIGRIIEAIEDACPAGDGPVYGAGRGSLMTPDDPPGVAWHLDCAQRASILTMEDDPTDWSDSRDEVPESSVSERLGR